jgi:hypothetical protein
MDTLSGRCCGMSRFACDNMVYGDVLGMFDGDDHAAVSAQIAVSRYDKRVCFAYVCFLVR